jgi:hypothetical protein
LPMVSRVRRASRNAAIALALPFFQVVGRLRAPSRGCDLKATPRENCSCERADGPGDENRRRGGCDPAADFGSTAAPRSRPSLHATDLRPAPAPAAPPASRRWAD